MGALTNPCASSFLRLLWRILGIDLLAASWLISKPVRSVVPIGAFSNVPRYGWVSVKWSENVYVFTWNRGSFSYVCAIRYGMHIRCRQRIPPCSIGFEMWVVAERRNKVRIMTLWRTETSRISYKLAHNYGHPVPTSVSWRTATRVFGAV